MPNFTGYPLAINKTDATLTDNDHAPHHNATAQAANELQAQVTAIRHRCTRNATAYGTGDVAITAITTTVENVGGITRSGGTFTLPSAGVYGVLFWAQAASGGWATAQSGVVVAIGGNNYRLPFHQGSTSLRVAASMMAYCAAGSTISFSLTNGTGASVTASVGWEIFRIPSG